MKHVQYCFLICLVSVATSGYAQLVDNFDDGSLTNNVLWDGDIDDFIINKDLQLQLSAGKAGDSYIHAPLRIDGDSTVFELDFGMAFKPSGGNKLRVYLAIDRHDVSTANGYFIEVGENGSKDAIVLYRLDGGTAVLLQRGIDGRYADKSKMSRLCATYFSGVWTIYSTLLMDGNEVEEVSLEDAFYDIKSTQFFGLECTYTATRKDKFFFDNIDIGAYVPDTIPPSVVDVEVLDSIRVCVTYSEKMDSTSVARTSAYTINDTQVASVTVDDNLRKFTLTAASVYDASRKQLLRIDGARDANGNIMLPTEVSFLYARPAYRGAILLSEVLTDPYPEGEDFIELYNASDQYISLHNCSIINTQNSKEAVIENEVVMPPKSYLAISPDVDQLVDIYMPPDDFIAIEHKLPALNNASANITILSAGMDTLDSYDYDEDMHFALLKDTEGVSMERTALSLRSNAWHSASASTRYATPGYKNSNSTAGKTNASGFSLGSDVLSPDNDGMDDVLHIQYSLDMPGYTATIRIFSAEGHHIATLSNNELLGVKGSATWDGISDAGTRVPMGHYIVVVDAIHPEGARQVYKEAFAVVYRL